MRADGQSYILTVSPFHWQGEVSVHIIADLAKGGGGT